MKFLTYTSQADIKDISINAKIVNYKVKLLMAKLNLNLGFLKVDSLFNFEFIILYNSLTKLILYYQPLV